MLKPKFFTIFKTITRKQFFKDFIAGIIVGIVALSLAIAFDIEMKNGNTCLIKRIC